METNRVLQSQADLGFSGNAVHRLGSRFTAEGQQSKSQLGHQSNK